MSPHLTRNITTALSSTLTLPAFAVAAGEGIHLLAPDKSRRGTVCLVLDREGMLTRSIDIPRLSIVSVGGCGNWVVVTGVDQSANVRWVMGLDVDGTLHWEIPLPIPTTGLVWVVPTCIAGQPVIVWEVEREKAGELSFASVREKSLGSVLTSVQPGNAFGLSVATIGTSLFILRGRGAEVNADLLCIREGVVSARVATVKNAHAIAAVGERLVVLSWTVGAIFLQWFDTLLMSLGAPEEIATVDSPSWIRFATLHAASEDRIVVSYLVGTSDDLIQMPSGRSEPSVSVCHFIGRYDAASHALTDISEVTPAGTAWIAGVWLGDRLLFVHGTTSAALSIFELERGTP